MLVKIEILVKNIFCSQIEFQKSGTGESTDYTVQLCGVIIRAMEIEMAAMKANICHAWSPQTAEDLRWLLLRFAEAYIWFAEDHHSTVSTRQFKKQRFFALPLKFRLVGNYKNIFSFFWTPIFRKLLVFYY